MDIKHLIAAPQSEVVIRADAVERVLRALIDSDRHMDTHEVSRAARIYENTTTERALAILAKQGRAKCHILGYNARVCRTIVAWSAVKEEAPA